jgi:hypothetical protein
MIRTGVRWEAARALRDIADPRAAAALVRSLRDRALRSGWLASDGLIALKEAGCRRLTALCTRRFRAVENGAHHVLSDLSRGHVSRDVAETLKPVIEALESLEASIAVPMAARRALDAPPPRVRRSAVV